MSEVQQVRCELRVDDEFRSLIPPLSEDERAKIDVNAELRRLNPKPTAREACYVCGKFKDITHAHHVPALSDVKNELGSLKAQMVDVPCIWLCPNHHAIWHVADQRAGESKIVRLMDDQSEYELDRLEQLETFENECWQHLASASEEIDKVLESDEDRRGDLS